jgi:hypothetical protein
MPHGTKWGPLVSHLVTWWGPQWWGGPIVDFHVACTVEVASLCAAIWHLFSLLCITHTLPSGGSAGVAYDVAQSDLAMCLWMVWHGWMVACHVAWAGWGCPVMACHVALLWGPLADLDQWDSATWHLAVELTQSGAAMWHCNSNWFFFLNWHSFLSPSCTQIGICPQVVPREAYDQISAPDLLI